MNRPDQQVGGKKWFSKSHQNLFWKRCNQKAGGEQFQFPRHKKSRKCQRQ